MRALLLIDIQNDFLPGGSLAVSDGNEVVAVSNDLIPDYELIVATQDWHPADHRSFVSQNPERQPGEMITLDGIDQIVWPDHCVQGTSGAEFASRLNTDAIHHVIQKGTDRDIHSYSGFFDNARRKATGLEKYLRGQGIDEVHLTGLATDYCVKFTALDAIDRGFQTVVLAAGVRGVELHEGDCDRAFAELKAAGIAII